MSFFSKLKQMAGIGTLQVKLQAPSSFKADDTQLEGTLNITAKSDQQIIKITVELREEFETGRDENKKEQRFVLGTVSLGQAGEIKSGENRVLPFVLPIHFRKSANQQLSERGGLMGGIGKLGSWANDEKSTYKLYAEVDVKGTPIDPSDSIDMKLVK